MRYATNATNGMRHGMPRPRGFQQQMFDGHAGLSLQTDDGGVGAIRRDSAESHRETHGETGTAQLGAGAPWWFNLFNYTMTQQNNI